MTRIARLVAVLFFLAAILSVGSLTIGAAATHQSNSESGHSPVVEAELEASVRCLSFGLYGEITAEAVVDKLSDSSNNLAFVGTSNGLYVIGLDGKLQHFLYSPFGVKQVALIDDITGDGSHEVVVVLNNTLVPALRCYDGVTWEKLWQFAPMAKVWDDTWVERQLGIGSLDVKKDGSTQSIVFISGRRVFSLDARDGTENWQSGTPHAPKRLAAVGDLNGDEAGEVFLTTEDGYLCLLNGKTGQTRWRTRLPEITAHGETTQSTAEHILTLDREAGRVAVTCADGFLRLFDLNARELEWEVSFATQEASAPGPIAMVPDVTSDPGILVCYYSPTPSASGMGVDVRPRTALLDTAGNKLWDREFDAWSLDTGSCGGKPVIMVPTAAEIKLLDLADGESEVKTIPVSTPDEWGADVRQIGEDAFLLVGSLTAISSSGEVLWYYPRIGNVRAASGHFVGDATEDVLFSAEWKTTSQYSYTPPTKNDGVTLVSSAYQYSPEVPEAEVRLLKVMDGATGEITWSYEVPLIDLKSSGGLKGLKVTADLVGNDGIQDIIGYREDTVFILSGKDGVFSSFSAGQPVYSLDVIHNGAPGNALVVGTAAGLTIFDSSGIDLWSTASTEWAEADTVKFTALDDLNSDNIGDLAVLSPTRIVLLTSTDNATGYELHLTLNPETDCLIEYVEFVPDVNGDGVRELAYIQRKPGMQQQDQYTPPGCPELLKQSPVGGEQLLRVELPANSPAVDLACGDFDGDGFVDSLICYNSYDTCSGVGPDQRGSSQNYSGYTLLIISGKDGATMWSHGVNLQNYAGGGWRAVPPATNVGDVSGDGRDDLAWTANHGFEAYSGYYCQRQRVEIYDMANDRSLRVLPVTPLMRGGGWYSSGESDIMLPEDIDGDGRCEVLATVSEQTMASYGQMTYYPGDTSTRYLAVVDTASGEHLAAFMGFALGSSSVFGTHQPGVLGVTASGGVYYLDTSTPLDVTSPADGAKTGPVVPIRWDGTSDGEFVQVFVDGVRNHAGNGSGVDLYLACGKHDIVVRSTDDCGRISYSPADLSKPLTAKVTPSLWKPILLLLSLFVLLSFVMLLFHARLHRIWRARWRGAQP
ncbi:MAG: PQQ-binding-like beta-propeller repeat protein [Dehalococcoidia bacterium]|nr:PQQ-binding-like beta-propeller repeat protein [Dehalococcoidia bacterium]